MTRPETRYATSLSTISSRDSPISCDQEFCRISAALRHGLNSGSDFVGFLMLRNEHHGRDARLYSIAIRFPKLDVAGSIPVSRSYFKTLAPAQIPPFPLVSKRNSSST